MSFDPEERIRSESVLLTCTSDDGRWGIFGRLCRYPSAHVAWVWMHVFLDGRVIGYADDAVPCETDELATKADDVSYRPLDPSLVLLERNGPRDTPGSATLHARVPAHETRDTPRGPGEIELVVDATFTPEYARGATLFGRSEVLGTVQARVPADGQHPSIDGRGQWHEQHQHAPRFRQPFSYASLRGDGLALVALAGPWGSYGFVRRGDGSGAETTAVTFEDLSRVLVEVDGDPSCAFDVDVVTGYTLPLYGRPWCGHQVVASTGSERLSGFINVWAG